MVTAILTIWKRDHLEEQIETLLKQTVPPEKIWVYQCHNYVSIKKILKKYPQVQYQYNTNNLSYFGRFSIALHAKTPYVYIVDDDVLPTLNWLENCIRICDAENAILASSGRRLPVNDYNPEVVKGRKQYYDTFIGDSDNLFHKNYCPQDTYIDYGCNSWFLKTDWLNYFWSVKPYTLTNGEDIHLSASCAIRGGIKTICPYQDGKNIAGNMMKFYGWDKHASHIKPDFFNTRERIFRYLIDECGWKPINW
ncbi:MAG: glycosyltransferase family 2 protein [Sphingobacteriaceae bacterium]|nr:MAG: glycosyltransferase family 2 protein [Sphingobacteriaceae bacterium]